MGTCWSYAWVSDQWLEDCSPKMKAVLRSKMEENVYKGQRIKLFHRSSNPKTVHTVKLLRVMESWLLWLSQYFNRAYIFNELHVCNYHVWFYKFRCCASLLPTQKHLKGGKEQPSKFPSKLWSSPKLRLKGSHIVMKNRPPSRDRLGQICQKSQHLRHSEIFFVFANLSNLF